ncbi:hypothetical protein DYB26_005503 [Aphanomyces astaci]|uniref:E3 ubiquitin protein ligase n=2 Tax=Aphanomyces astaci TaxID=112090 RepID=A0A418EN62_APHAT|nr:hypothetical protein DYB26_005503 [Aphanomyces astaci]
MLHRSARGLRTGSAVAWTRGMSSVQVNNDVISLGAIERAVSEATAVLRKQLHDAEVENAQLRQALTKATRMLPSEQPPPSLAQAKPLVIPAIHVPSPPLHDVKKQQPPLVHAVPPTTVDDVEKAAPTEAKMKSDLYGGSTPVQFYFRLIECTRKYMLSPKLRKTLATMPLLQMSWTAKEAPAILTALILMDRHHDAKTFASRYASDAALQHRFMAQASRLRCPDVAISILANVAEHHSNEAIDAYLYTGAISACSNGPVEFVPSAFDLFEDMAHSAHVDPTPLTYSAVLTACSRLDKWDYEALKLKEDELTSVRDHVKAVETLKTDADKDKIKFAREVALAKQTLQMQKQVEQSVEPAKPCEQCQVHHRQEKLRQDKLREARASLANNGDGEVSELERYELVELRKKVKCSVCQDAPKEVMISKCSHMFCKECMESNLKARNRKCPTCKKMFGQDDVKGVYWT